jgi:hypothetical protein
VQLNYARYFVPDLFPALTGRILYLDDDVVVQGLVCTPARGFLLLVRPGPTGWPVSKYARGEPGDVAELLQTTDLRQHAVAFASDCSWLSKKYQLHEVRMALSGTLQPATHTRGGLSSRQQNHYDGFLNFQHPAIQRLGMDPRSRGQRICLHGLTHASGG